jgi:hypothetical protein
MYGTFLPCCRGARAAAPVPPARPAPLLRGEGPSARPARRPGHLRGASSAGTVQRTAPPGPPARVRGPGGGSFPTKRTSGAGRRRKATRVPRRARRSRCATAGAKRFFGAGPRPAMKRADRHADKRRRGARDRGYLSQVDSPLELSPGSCLARAIGVRHEGVSRWIVEDTHVI